MLESLVPAIVSVRCRLVQLMAQLRPVAVWPVLDRADVVITSDRDESGKGWTRWANDAFLNGAGKAHKFSQIRALQGVAEFSEADHHRPC